MRTRQSRPVWNWVLLAGLLVWSAACGGSGNAPVQAPIETTLDGAADHVGERVVVEGYLVTDSTITCGGDTICWLWLASEPEGDDGLTYSQPDEYILVGVPEYFDSNPPHNVLAHIPVTWKPADIVVRSDDLKEIHLNDHVRVTGWVEVRGDGYTRLSLGSFDCSRVPWSDECPETGFTLELVGA